MGYFDPPEDDMTPPRCVKCDEFMELGDVNGKPAWVCINCGNDAEPIMIPDEPEPFIDEGPYPGDGEPPVPETCPHGNKWGECHACDVAADHAFHAAREDRCFGRR